jgi:proline dehydrogenase
MRLTGGDHGSLVYVLKLKTSWCDQHTKGRPMFRSFLIYLSKAAWARRIVTRWAFAWRAASRFVAGENVEDAIATIKVLNSKGIFATLDLLGEHTTTAGEARQAAQDIQKMMDSIQAAGIKANVSIKLTQIGLALGGDVCTENLCQILTHAREFDMFVRIDMEDAPWVEATLELYSRMRQQYNLTNTGIVIQAYLYRSEEDVRRLAAAGTRIRLCKGAYKEPPEIAFPKKSDVDAGYDRLAEILIDGAVANGAPFDNPDGKIPPIPAIASHDPRRLAYAKTYAEKVGLPKQAIEFQMLYGIRRDLQDQLVREGFPVRVYVPFGTEWYPYFVRRLAERPANLWFFISNFFRK